MGKECCVIRLLVMGKRREEKEEKTKKGFRVFLTVFFSTNIGIFHQRFPKQEKRNRKRAPKKDNLT